MAKKKLRIALLGLGTVGRGVYDYITERDDMELAYVLSLVLFDGITCPVAKNMEQILADETVDTVVEVIGGLHPAYEWVKASLEAGKNVITANKLLIAAHYRELVELAEEKHVALRCTAAAGGGIPWLTTLARTIEQEPVIHISGIMNGTTNFILDAMHTNGSDFAEVLAQAQELGYAEADPSADIDGLDIQRKAVITANVAFDACLCEADVPVFGIRSVSSADIAAADGRGRICKMLAFGEKGTSGVSCYVEPCFVPAGELEAAVSTNRNVISFDTELTGKESFYGQGAGRYPTAYNAVADCVDIMNGVKSFYTRSFRSVPVDNGAAEHPYYVRFNGADDFLDSVSVEDCGEGVITMPVPVSKMHDWAAKAKEADPELFIAGLM